MTSPLPRPAWLVLTYRLPPGSTLRSVIRRRLTSAGAVYLANAVAVAPATPGTERAFRRTRKTITEAGGSAQVLRAHVLAGQADWAEGVRPGRSRSLV